MTGQLLVLAKEPTPGLVKTRLCPPCTPAEAAEVAAAALADTVATVAATAAHRRVLVLHGQEPRPTGFTVLPQRGVGLPQRLAHAFTDSALPGVPALLIGMDTPQVSPGLLASALHQLATSDAVLGLAEDGGWWALGLHDVTLAAELAEIPTSTSDTGRQTLAALRARGAQVRLLETLRDVDTVADAQAVAAACPADSRFSTAVRQLTAVRR